MTTNAPTTESPAELQDSGPICYRGHDDQMVFRPCRTWLLADGRVLAIVTETPEATLSVTNAADKIVRTLLPGLREHYYYADGYVIAEHYPAGYPGADDVERYAILEHDGYAFTGFKHLPVETVQQWVGAEWLDYTAPLVDRPMEHGVWTSRASLDHHQR